MLFADSRTWNSSGEVSRISSTEPDTNWNSSEISPRRSRASLSVTLEMLIAALPSVIALSTRPNRLASRPNMSAACTESSSPASTLFTEPRIRSASSDWRWATETWAAGAPLCSRMSTTSSYSTCNCGMVSARVAATWCRDNTVCSLARMASEFFRRLSQSCCTAAISACTASGADGRPVDSSPPTRMFQRFSKSLRASFSRAKASALPAAASVAFFAIRWDSTRSSPEWLMYSLS
ncbi:hypothetical protein D9M68_397620 [compost metagenome]